MRRLATLLVLPPAVLAAQTVTPAGHWEGTLELPGMKLAFSLDLKTEGDSLKGTVTIPQQGAKDLPLEKLVLEGGTLSCTLTGVPGAPTFRGTLAGDTFKGTFTQGGQSFPFAATRQAAPAAKAASALAGFEAVVEKIRADWKVPGIAVAVVKGGEVIYAKGHGLRDVARNLPMTEDTLLPIGSSTKAFTTAVLASLVDEGKLDWAKPVRTWIPWFRLQDAMATERMTPMDLVTHRSGMPRHDAMWYNATLGREEMVRRLQHLEPNKDFRTDFQYNNAMFLTAGYLSEVVTGKTWEENVRQRLLEPLGMRRTNFTVEANQQDANFSQPYREEKDGTVKAIPYRGITNVGPAGSINSSVKEMAAWVAMHLQQGTSGGKVVLSPSSVTLLHTPQMVTGQSQTKPELVPGGYAPGWFTDVYRGHLRIHHGGNIDGFSAQVMLVPGSDLGIVVLTNLDSTPTRDLIPNYVLDKVLGLEARDWSGEALAKKKAREAAGKEAEAKKKATRKAGTKPSLPLEAYVGTYAHPGYGPIDVKLAGGKLVVTYNGIVTPFEHWHFDVFNGLKAEDPAFEDAKVQFRLGLEGEVEGLESVMETSVKPILFTRQADARLTDPAFLQRLTGTYVLAGAGQEVQIELRGKGLVAILKGQPTLELEPQRGTRFALKGLSGFSLQFLVPASGSATEVAFDQPDGIYTAKRK